MDPHAIPDLLSAWGYPALFVLLLVTAFGSPVPEDLLLVAAGYLVSVGLFQWPLAFLICVAGVISSDLLLYLAGRHVARRSGCWSRRLPPERLARATQWFGRCGDAVILIARLTPGTRVLVFVTAGMRGVPPARFLRYDAAGAVLWVPAMLAAGGLFGDRIGDLNSLIAVLGRGALWAAAVAALLLVVWIRWGCEESKL